MTKPHSPPISRGGTLTLVIGPPIIFVIFYVSSLSKLQKESIKEHRKRSTTQFIVYSNHIRPIFGVPTFQGCKLKTYINVIFIHFHYSCIITFHFRRCTFRNG